MVSPLNFINSNNNNSTYLIPTKDDKILMGFFDTRYRKKQKKTNTYNICDKKNTRENARNNRSKNILRKKYETKKSFNLYRLNEKYNNMYVNDFY